MNPLDPNHSKFPEYQSQVPSKKNTESQKNEDVTISEIAKAKLKKKIEEQVQQAKKIPNTPHTSEHYTITLVQMEQLTPRGFWRHISETLESTLSLQKVEIEGQGTFDRTELSALLNLKTHIAPQKLCQFIEKLKTTVFSLQDYKKEDYNKLHLHVIAGREDLIISDLENTAIDVTDKYGNSALKWACSLGFFAIARHLIQYNANLNFGSTPPLTEAVLREEFDIVELLLEKGADVNIQDNDGWTPLMSAANAGHTNIVELLLQKGADVYMKNKEATTVLTLLKFQRPKNRKKIKQAIINHTCSKIFKEAKIYYDLYKDIKLLSHAYEYSGTAIIQSLEVPLTGGHSQVVATTMARSIQAFAKSFPLLLNKPSARHLAQCLQFAADQNSHTPLQTLQRINRGIPACILTGYRGHAVTVLIWGDLFILCDRKRGSKLPLLIYRFEQKKLSEQAINQLRNLKNKTRKEYNLTLQKISAELGFRQTENEIELQKLGRLPFQKVGNCSWASVEGIVKAYLLLDKLKDGPVEETRIKEDLESTFTSWLYFQRVELLDKYLDHSVNHELILQTFNTLWDAKTTEPKLLERIIQLESKYQTIASPINYQRFVTSKTMRSTPLFSHPKLYRKRNENRYIHIL